MIALCIVLAFAAGVCVKVFVATGDVAALGFGIFLSVVCLVALVGYMIRDRGLL